jgi:hypothetical protein
MHINSWGRALQRTQTQESKTAIASNSRTKTANKHKTDKMQKRDK